MREREKSAAFGGGAFGDEGKGRIVDEFASDFARVGPVIIYRDNGGAGTGHTSESEEQRMVFHQLPSGALEEKATLVLGKGMVLHPGDLIAEIERTKKMAGGEIPATIMIDEMATLSLDTHRAYEQVLREWHEGGRGSTSRGIAPAYADILLRHPLRMRDLVRFDKKLIDHYLFYEAVINGLGRDLREIKVPSLVCGEMAVGSLQQFLERLRSEKEALLPLVTNIFDFLSESWSDERKAFVFEKAQGIGLDTRFGVYPDVTASDTTFGGILSSTEGIVNPKEIQIRAGVIKATYMSSVGTRRLPTMMEEEPAKKIREDANEFGATTRRPRGIAYPDLPALKFFAKVADFNYLILTHLDVVYPNEPIKVCVAYEINGREVPYRPDQEYLDEVEPKYIHLPSWRREAVTQAREAKELPNETKLFLDFISGQIGLPILMVTTGPKRGQGIRLKNF